MNESTKEITIERLNEILSKMTPEEKIALASGKNFWQTKDYPQYGIPSIFTCDGPHGLRKQEGEATDMIGVNKSRPSTCFPAEVTTASSWDTALLERIGRAIAEEARSQKVGMVLGPGACIKRNPLCGRNFEYFSEDPYLAGKLAAAFIRGVESQGVCTSLKHFACNQQELDRLVSDSILDERTLRELYLSAFEIAVKEGRPSTLMCSYPKINGVHCSDDKRLLTDILRDEWGFKGAVISDWGAMNDRIAGFRAGCDLNMPGGAAYMEREAADAVRNGSLPEEAVDRSAARVLRLALRASEAMTGENCDYEAHYRLAEEAALGGAVLLRNEDGLLPLKAESSLALIGAMAKEMRYQGSGSSHINAMKLTQPADCFPGVRFSPGYDRTGQTTDELLADAAGVARSCDVAVVFAGLPERYESEGFDRDTMALPEGHNRLIETVSAANPNTVVVLFSGSAVECPWADCVKSILYMGLPGEAGGSAVRKLLCGEAIPSGRLAESWPFDYRDVPSSEIFGKTRDALYEEGLYIGYRFYEKAGLSVRWPFGHGLSYSRFDYSDLRAEKRGNSVQISLVVTNIGAYDASEAVLLYVAAPQNGLHRPLRELKSFTKLFLKQGESRRAEFALDARSFALWEDGWKVPAGQYEIQIGQLTVRVDIEGETLAVPDWQPGSFYEHCQGKPVRVEWEKMLGRCYTPPATPKKGSYTMENSMEEMRKHSFIMKIMYRATVSVIKKNLGKREPDDPELRMMLICSVAAPLRSTYISSGMEGGLFPGLLEMANGRFFKGLGRMMKK